MVPSAPFHKYLPTNALVEIYAIINDGRYTKLHAACQFPVHIIDKHYSAGFFDCPIYHARLTCRLE